jgi:hypothetical protein
MVNSLKIEESNEWGAIEDSDFLRNYSQDFSS